MTYKLTSIFFFILKKEKKISVFFDLDVGDSRLVRNGTVLNSEEVWNHNFVLRNALTVTKSNHPLAKWSKIWIKHDNLIIIHSKSANANNKQFTNRIKIDRAIVNSFEMRIITPSNNIRLDYLMFNIKKRNLSKQICLEERRKSASNCMNYRGIVVCLRFVCIYILHIVIHSFQSLHLPYPAMVLYCKFEIRLNFAIFIARNKNEWESECLHWIKSSIGAAVSIELVFLSILNHFALRSDLKSKEQWTDLNTRGPFCVHMQSSIQLCSNGFFLLRK